MDYLTKLNTDNQNNQWPKPSEIFKNTNKRNSTSQLPATILKPTQESDMSDMTASQMKTEIKECSTMNKTLKTTKRSEIYDIVLKMNEEVNKQLTQKN